MEIVFEGVTFKREPDGTCSKDTIAAIRRKISGLKRRKVPNEEEIARLTHFIESVYVPPAAPTTTPAAPTAAVATNDDDTETESESESEAESEAEAEAEVGTGSVDGSSSPVPVSSSVVDDDTPSPPKRPPAPPLILSVELNYISRVLEFVHRCLGTAEPTVDTYLSVSTPMPGSLDAVMFRSPSFRPEEYIVTPKIDGERMFLAIAGFTTISGKTNYLSALVSLRGVVYPVKVEAPRPYFAGTLLDGEFDEKTNMYYPFDIVRVAGHDYRGSRYSEVLDALQKITREVTWARDGYSIVWGRKPFVQGTHAQSLRDYVDRMKCDGLVYTHENRVYTSKGYTGIYKWKMVPSIDVAVELSDEPGRPHVCPWKGRLGFAMLVSKRMDPFAHGSKVVLSTEDKQRLFDVLSPAAHTGARYIFEFEITHVDCKWHVYEPKRSSDIYDESSEDDRSPERAKTVVDVVHSLHLKILRERRDKTAPNHPLTIQSTIADCANRLNWTDL